MKQVHRLILAGFFGILLAASLQLPPRGDPDAPKHRLESAAGTPVAGSYYIRHAYEDTHTENMVTAVLADYRAYDTLGETVVIFTAGAASILILRRRKKR